MGVGGAPLLPRQLPESLGSTLDLFPIPSPILSHTYPASVYLAVLVCLSYQEAIVPCSNASSCNVNLYCFSETVLLCVVPIILFPSPKLLLPSYRSDPRKNKGVSLGNRITSIFRFQSFPLSPTIKLSAFPILPLSPTTNPLLPSPSHPPLLLSLPSFPFPHHTSI